jgi:hypothetical protein
MDADNPFYAVKHTDVHVLIGFAIDIVKSLIIARLLSFLEMS